MLQREGRALLGEVLPSARSCDAPNAMLSQRQDVAKVTYLQMSQPVKSKNRIFEGCYRLWQNIWE